MLEKIDDPELVVHAIWTPILPADRKVTARARKTLPDPRVRQWWDGERWAQEAFRQPLGLREGQPAWDVYLVYPGSARWSGEGPPNPVFHQHQLRELDQAHLLDGRYLRRKVEELLPKKRDAGQ